MKKGENAKGRLDYFEWTALLQENGHHIDFANWKMHQIAWDSFRLQIYKHKMPVTSRTIAAANKEFRDGRRHVQKKTIK